MLTHHHILLDGWSVPLLVQELLALYATAATRRAAARCTAYREYLAWLPRRTATGAVSAWREALAGLDEPTLVRAGPQPAREPATPEQS